MSEVIFLDSNKGNNCCIFKNYKFYLAKQSDKDEVFRCSTKYYKARLIMSSPTNIYEDSVHNYDAIGDEDVTVMLAKSKMKHFRKTLQITNREIYVQTAAGLDIVERNKLGYSKNLGRTLRYIKGWINNEFLNDCEHDDIPELFKQTLDRNFFKVRLWMC